MSTKGMDFGKSQSDDWGFKGKNYLLVIGIDKYSEWKPLNNAVRDALDFIEVLKTHYQFEDQYIYTLFNEEATEDNIHNKMLDLVRTVKDEDNLLIYYSGHGHFIEELQQGYWVPADAPKGASVRKYISNSDLVNYLKNIQSHHTFLIVDSCFSGSLMTQLRSGVRSERYPSRRIFASGRNEVVEDGVAGKNSPFAAGIINYLKRNNDRSLKTTTLIEDVKSYLEKQDIKQTPVDGRIKSLGDDGGEFIFYLKKTEEDIWRDLSKEGSVADYEKYMDYFPSGKYVEEAQDIIHALKEDDYWKQVGRRNNVQAYNDYIQEYPGGRYSQEAFTHLEKIEEEVGWADATRLNSLSGFQRYLVKYSRGKYAEEARDRIAKLRGQIEETDAEVQERQRELDQLIQHEEAFASAKKRYNTLFAEAEKLFAAKDYPAAQQKYMECLREYRKGFEPDEKFVTKRHEECEKLSKFSSLYKKGKAAHEGGNHDLAVHYYKKALELYKSPKLEVLIREASSKKKGGTTRLKPSPKKKSNSVKYIIFGVVALLVGLGIIGIIVNAIEESAGRLDNYNSQDYLYSEPENNPVSGTGNFASDILGLWQCTNVQAELSEITPLFLNVQYNFLDGVVYENAVPLSYYVTGNQLNVNNGVIVGTILMPDYYNMSVTGTYNVQYIGSFPVTLTFRRI